MALVIGGVIIGAGVFGGAWALAAGGFSTGGGTLVATLPSCAAANDGQTVFYQTATMASTGALWRMRCNSGSSSSYKWEFAGGAPMTAEAGGTWSSPAIGPTSTYVNGALSGTPSLALPAAGEYMATASTNTRVGGGTPAAAACGFFISFNGAAPGSWQDGDALTGSGGGLNALAHRRGTMTAAGQTLTLNWLNANVGGNCQFYAVRLTATPIRLA